MFEQSYREQAEAELAHAAQRLWALRREALFGQYDSEEFDRAIITYRAAVVAAETSAARFVPTPRIRFVKWLVETGRLSDQ